MCHRLCHSCAIGSGTAAVRLACGVPLCHPRGVRGLRAWGGRLGGAYVRLMLRSPAGGTALTASQLV